MPEGVLLITYHRVELMTGSDSSADTVCELAVTR